MWSWFGVAGLKAEQVAALNIVGHGRKSSIKGHLVCELPALTSHHICHSRRDVPAQAAEQGLQRIQEIEVLARR